jgi:hypothetical protein
MNIKPVKKYSGILPAAAAALLGSLVTSCDDQKIVGIVPNPTPRDTPGRVPGEPQEQPTPTTPETPAETPTEAEPEEMPQILGGDVPMENLNLEP